MSFNPEPIVLRGPDNQDWTTIVRHTVPNECPPDWQVYLVTHDRRRVSRGQHWPVQVLPRESNYVEAILTLKKVATQERDMLKEDSTLTLHLRFGVNSNLLAEPFASLNVTYGGV